ncbi:DUF3180 domain-containing protein [Haloglycomyces albus]|uniref:DUF3180 domain-containing protein n=1 Tax=Haloglycomyces albus TaxID=526067 RepID=UPI0004BC1F33|nr:DUF3180 domain-containing protein [Haloglycomyces albus]
MTDQEPTPSLKPTTAGSIAVAALLGLSIAYVVASWWYQNLPTLEWYNAVALLVLALILAYLAWRTRKQLRTPTSEYEGEPFHALQMARLAVLGKACTVAGSFVAGAYAGFSLWLLLPVSQETAGTQHDTPNAIGGLGASIVLVAAAIWLERSCRIPPEDTNPEGGDDEG